MADQPVRHGRARVEKAPKYVPPEMEKHQPVKIVQGSGGGSSSSSCSGLYYSTLYYTYYY